MLEGVKAGYRESVGMESFIVKNEAPNSLKEAEKKEPLYTFAGSCSSNYTRRVHGFPARHSEANPIKCLPCQLSFFQCVVDRFNSSNSAIINLFHSYSFVCCNDHWILMCCLLLFQSSLLQ